MKVLVKEKIADAGVEMLRDKFDVELGVDWDDGELEQRIGEFDAILIRSGTKLNADLIDKADNLKAIGRAGTGVDNVDIEAATRRGIVVANAPESNSIAAAEHTLGLMLALCRNIPRAHASLAAGKWERSDFKGTELYGKTLGVVGFGRIGQLVAKRAQSFEMDVIAYDKFVTPERFRELGVEGVEDPDELLARSDFITLHLPNTPETIGLVDAESIAKMRDGARIVNCARGDLVDLDALQRGARVGQARRRGARRLPRGAPRPAHRLRARRRRRHPAPRRLDRRGPGSRRHRHRRAGDRGADQRRRHLRRQHRRRRPRADGGAGAVRAALREARQARPGPRRGGRLEGRGRVPGPDRRPRHPPAQHRRPLRDHGPAGGRHRPAR